MLAYLLLGIALGAGSSFVPGPCGLAVIDAASHHGVRRGLATALGAGLGDLTYAALGVFGTACVIAGAPAAETALIAVSGVFLIAYGAICLRGRPPSGRVDAGSLGGIAIGFTTLVCNPAALLTWSALVGARLAAATPLEQGCAVVGIGCGSLGWFSLVAYVSHRGRDRLGACVRRLVQITGGLLIGYGALSLARLL